jgi:flagellar motor switch protein FliN/FliY
MNKMEEDILSQEQIDALTQAVSDKDKAPASEGAPAGAVGGFSADQAQAIKDTLNHSFAGAVPVLTETLGAQVELTVNDVAEASEEAISNLLPAPYTIANFSFSQGFSGDLALLFAEGDANALSEALSTGAEAGAEESAEEGAEEAAPAAGQTLEGLLNQAMGAAAEALTSVFGEEVGFAEGSLAADDGSGLGVLTDGAVQANMSFKLEGIMDTQAICLMPVSTAAQMAGEAEEEAEEEVTAFADEDLDLGEAMAGLDSPDGVVGQPAEFSALAPGAAAVEGQNIDLLLDVSLPIVIELGRTSMKIQDILELGPGSVVELDKLAGEPVDIIVNDKQIAKGEVVVVEENFGVRITNLVSPLERIQNLR